MTVTWRRGRTLVAHEPLDLDELRDLARTGPWTLSLSVPVRELPLIDGPLPTWAIGDPLPYVDLLIMDRLRQPLLRLERARGSARPAELERLVRVLGQVPALVEELAQLRQVATDHGIALPVTPPAP